MLKSLAIAAFGLALFFANSPNEQASEQDRKTHNIPAPSVTIVDNSTRQTDASSPSQKPLEPHTGIEWSNWALVLIGALTFVAIWKQAMESARATRAMRDSIRLQQDEMAVTINKERPYLVVTAESTGANEFFLRAKNEGNTPARITSIWHGPVVTKRGQIIEIPSEEKTAESLVGHPPLLLPPKGGLMVFNWGITEMQGISLPPISSLYFYVRIRYFNTLESNQAQPYETRCLYWAVPVGDRLPIPDPRHPEHNTWT